MQTLTNKPFFGLIFKSANSHEFYVANIHEFGHEYHEFTNTYEFGH